MKRDGEIALAVGFAAFVYFGILAAKEWTWAFASFDSGDWLATSQIWMVPQPFGSPLYLLLGHGLNALGGDSLVRQMTAWLSVFPAAVSVALVYLIGRGMGLARPYALVGSLALAACGVYLSQATVLEEYALASMFVTAALYAHVKGQRTLVMLALGLGTTVHVIVAVLAVLWLAVHWREWRAWIRPVAFAYAPVVAAGYGLILALMAADTPRWLAGGLSLASLNAYLGSTGTIGKLALADAPRRLLEAGAILLAGFGINLVPLAWGLRRPWDMLTRLCAVLALAGLWLYVTDVDATTWTFLTFVLPVAAVLVARGLSAMPAKALGVGAVGAAALLVANGAFLGAGRLSADSAEPRGYARALAGLPDGAAIAGFRGGAYAYGVLKAIGEGRDFTLVLLLYPTAWDTQDYRDYLAWTAAHKGIEGANWQEQFDHALTAGTPVFVSYGTLTDGWREAIDARYTTAPYNTHFRQVVGGIPDNRGGDGSGLRAGTADYDAGQPLDGVHPVQCDAQLCAVPVPVGSGVRQADARAQQARAVGRVRRRDGGAGAVLQVRRGI